jgi:hypothetical protein
MAAIHLIKNDPGLPQITPIAQGADIFRDGYWKIAEATAEALIGGKIYFHKHKAEPSFFGGVITNTERVNQYPDRIGFLFKPDQACKDIKTPLEGWAQEMKIIL